LLHLHGTREAVIVNVAVLGCGPAGLLAAHAVAQAGHKPHIISRPEKSVIPGSVYLHAGIPDIHGPYPDNYVQYIRMGTAEVYAKKVYKDASRTTGWEHYMQTYPAWNALLAYETLWDYWHELIDPVCDITHEDVHDIVRGHDLVISTIPAQVLCYKPSEHYFAGEPYWIKTLPTPPLDEHRDVVVYNGLPDDAWYRWSVLGGVCSIETTLPGYFDEEKVGIVRGLKPRDNTCNCWPTVVRAGRWAEWRHGVLLNHAYNNVVSAIAQREVEA
jgi:hypothetical protein